MYGYIYLTTNKLNGKMYIGQHKASKYDCSYYGSGKILSQAIEKYGLPNFTNEIICWCPTKEELNQKEIEYINKYTKENPKLMYNLAKGGDGGDVFFHNQQGKDEFVRKMTEINRQRCSQDSFKQAISKAGSKRFKNKCERDKQREIAKKVWSDEQRRKEQSKKLSNYYKDKDRDCSFNNVRCGLMLNEKEIEFNSIKELREYMASTLNYTPDNRTFSKMLNSGEPLNPFHKNKFKDIIGLRIYKMNDDVETNRDECSGVGSEISTDSKDEAL